MFRRSYGVESFYAYVVQIYQIYMTKIRFKVKRKMVMDLSIKDRWKDTTSINYESNPNMRLTSLLELCNEIIIFGSKSKRD